MNKNYSNDKFSKPISQDELFTGAKTPEYAVFYNIAYWAMNDLISSYLAKYTKLEQPLNSLEPIDRFIAAANLNLIPDVLYLKLRDYLWKGYKFEKNSSGEELTSKDNQLVVQMVTKLSEIRNFHSHIWHDNAVLAFDVELFKWIMFLHDYAKDKLLADYPSEIREYEKALKERRLFDKHAEIYYIKQEGRNFFLSFFLKKSEMTRFMQHRKGCKRNDKPEFMIKHLVYRFYTHRDGATKNMYSVDNSLFSTLDPDSQNEITQARQVLKMLTYLNDIPTEVTDTKLFPLYVEKQKVETASQLIGYIEKYNLFKRFKFEILETKEGETKQKELAIQLDNSNYWLKVRTSTLHKLVLDVLRDPEREGIIYSIAEKFIAFRYEFPGIAREFLNEINLMPKMQEYSTFKMKGNDRLQEKLADLIERVSLGKKASEKAEKVIAQAQKAFIELTYYDFYFEQDQKPRSVEQFLSYGVNYLIDKNVTPQILWMTEKFETEEMERVRVKSHTEEKVNVLTRKKTFSSEITDDYRLAVSNGHVLFRFSSEPQFTFAMGEKALRNLLIAYFRNKPIEPFFNGIVSDLNKIKQAAITKQPISETELSVLTLKAIPHFMQLMMGHEAVVQGETLATAKLKARKRLEQMLDEFQKMKTNIATIDKKDKNRQLIRCYKYFDWKYDHSSQFKFLRQNEYQLMSIYHYTIAVEGKRHGYLKDLRKKLFVDIEQHLPETLRKMLENNTTLDGLLYDVLSETSGLMRNWLHSLESMKPEKLELCLRKIGIHVPAEPVPDASNQKNLPQLAQLPFAIHPELIFNYCYGSKTNTLSEFRYSPLFSQGILKSHYNYQPYLQQTDQSHREQYRQACEVIGAVNTVQLADMVICEIVKRYLKDSTSQVLTRFNDMLKENPDGEFRMTELQRFDVPVYKTSVKETNPFKVTVLFKQLGDFMLISDKKYLPKIVNQLFKRYPSNEQLEKIGIVKRDGFYVIPYVQVKQELDRIQHESLMVTDMLLDWERDVVEKIRKEEKEKLIAEATKSNGKGKAHLKFPMVCRHAELSGEEEKLLTDLRNSAMHCKIPEEDWTFKEKLHDDRIKNLLNITEEKLKKYESKSAIYEALASDSKN